jgi:hypothetical protein
MPQQLRPHMRSLALPVGAGQCRAMALVAVFKIFYGSFVTRDISFRSVALNPMLPRPPLAAIIFAGCSTFCNGFLLRNRTCQLNLSSARTEWTKIPATQGTNVCLLSNLARQRFIPAKPPGTPTHTQNRSGPPACSAVDREPSPPISRRSAAAPILEFPDRSAAKIGILSLPIPSHLHRALVRQLFQLRHRSHFPGPTQSFRLVPKRGSN